MLKNSVRTSKRTNTTLHRYKDQPVNDGREIIAVYCENHMKTIKRLRGQNAVTD
jgi:hypothetical protein